MRAAGTFNRSAAVHAASRRLGDGDRPTARAGDYRRVMVQLPQVHRTIRRWLGVVELDADGVPVDQRPSRYGPGAAVSPQLDADLDDLRARVEALERDRSR